QDRKTAELTARHPPAADLEILRSAVFRGRDRRLPHGARRAVRSVRSTGTMVRVCGFYGGGAIRPPFSCVHHCERVWSWERLGWFWRPAPASRPEKSGSAAEKEDDPLSRRR